MTDDKKVLLVIPKEVLDEAEKRSKKNRRSRNAQIVHDIETANQGNQIILKGSDLQATLTKYNGNKPEQDADKAINEAISVLEMTLVRQEKELAELDFKIKYNKARLKKLKAALEA